MRDWKTEPPNTVLEVAAMVFTLRNLVMPTAVSVVPIVFIVVVGLVLKAVFGVECIGVCD